VYVNQTLPLILSLPAELSRACRLIVRQRLIHQNSLAKFKRQGRHTEASASPLPPAKATSVGYAAGFNAKFPIQQHANNAYKRTTSSSGGGNTTVLATYQTRTAAKQKQSEEQIYVSIAPKRQSDYITAS
jgi:hypothetical protein